MKQIMILFFCCCCVAGWAQQHDEDVAESVEEIIQIVEQMPEFPGGEKELLMYLASVRYPAMTREPIEGKVYVRFVIDTAGNVTNAEIVRGVEEILDNVVLEHVKKMPAWKPGTRGGIPVNVQYTIPVRFKTATYDDTTNKEESGK